MLWVEEDKSLEGYIKIGDKLSPVELAPTSMKPFEECDTFIKRLYIRDRRSAFYITTEKF